MRFFRRPIIILALLCVGVANAVAQQEVSLDGLWHFRDVHAVGVWYRATVPGTIHTDLLAAHLISDPYYGDNERGVQWVEDIEWEYEHDLSIPVDMQRATEYYLQFDGLDTWADVYLNDSLILHADNMFRQWTIPLKRLIRHLDKRPKRNVIRIRFLSAARIAKERKKAEVIPYPDNERIYARKAQYQFGWDWGPRLVTAGIWRSVRLTTKPAPFAPPPKNMPVQLVTKDDAAGQSFYFTKNGKPVYIKGANWIPLDNFIPRAVRLGRYEQVIREAKEAGINMLRVWGGGIYEEDIFYDLCDQYGIMVWQDFMFAGAMYPGDYAFLKNVAAEVRYQVGRLRRHPCIVLWCGNNEIDEAWHNWGWQKALKYSKADSAQIWNDYQKLFHHIIPDVLKDLDPGRPYWPSSPSTGWGRDEAYKRGDVHYWGVWWGREPVRTYKEKVGRFNSEYGMQAFPEMVSIMTFSMPGDWDIESVVMKTHQKHPFGYQNIGMYIAQRFHTPRSFEDLVYVSGLMQADAIGTAIGAHRGAKPYNMGTLYWQLNDCWPAVSWSSIDYYGRKKPLQYRLRELYAPVLIVADRAKRNLKITVSSDTDFARPLRLRVSAHYLNGRQNTLPDAVFEIFVRSDSARHYFCPIPKTARRRGKHIYYTAQLLKADTEIASSVFFLTSPKKLHLTVPEISLQIDGDQLRLRSDVFAYGVQVNTPDGITPADNYFHLLPGVEKTVQLRHDIYQNVQKETIKIRSLRDTYTIHTLKNMARRVLTEVFRGF